MKEQYLAKLLEYFRGDEELLIEHLINAMDADEAIVLMQDVADKNGVLLEDEEEYDEDDWEDFVDDEDDY
jgi:hypothetical protein